MSTRIIVRSALHILLALYLSTPAFAINATIDHTSVVEDWCNNGVEQAKYKICPSGWSAGAVGSGGPAPELAIQGWKAVTQPLDATASGVRIDVGGGNNDLADLSTLDPGILTPGSVVNVFHRAQPYNSKLFIFTKGTETDPIIFNGVSDASGNPPRIDFNNATTANTQDYTTTLAPLGGIVFSYSRDNQPGHGYGFYPEYIEIRGFELYNAHYDYTNGDDNQPYFSGASPIRIQEGDHITIAGNIIHDNANGVFVHSGRANKSIRVAGNYFYNQGQVGSYLEHNIYLQAVSDTPFTNIVEGNVLFPLKSGAQGGSSLKHRGTDVIFRYNTVIGMTRPLDLVEAQDGLPYWIFDNLSAQEVTDRYRSTYIYGNVFYSSEAFGAWNAYGLHIGWDAGTSHPTSNELFAEAGTPYGQPISRSYDGTTYVYHNTFYKSVTEQYDSAWVDLGGAGNTGSSYPGNVHLANNVWHFVDTVTGAGSEAFISQLKETGTATYIGANYAYLEGSVNTTVYEGKGQANDPDITIVNPNNLTQSTTVSPLFTNPAPVDLIDIDLRPQAGSPIIGAAGALSAAMQAYPVLLQPNLPSLGGGALTRSTTNNLGAFE